MIAIERLSHGYGRLRVLKDRDGDLEVGDEWPLIFTHGEGFRLDPKEQETAEELEQRLLAIDPAWRTIREWAAELGIRQGRAREILAQMTESGQIEHAVGRPDALLAPTATALLPHRGISREQWNNRYWICRLLRLLPRL